MITPGNLAFEHFKQEEQLPAIWRLGYKTAIYTRIAYFECADDASKERIRLQKNPNNEILFLDKYTHTTKYILLKRL